MTTRRGILCLVAIGLGSLGCATTTTRLASVDPVAVEFEEEQQRELVLATLEEQQVRLERVGFPILEAAVPLCEPGVSFGLRVASAHAYDDVWVRAARAVLRVGDTLSVIGVAPGSPAEASGVLPGDRIVRIGSLGIADLAGSRAIDAYANFHEDLRDADIRDIELDVVRGARLETVRMRGVDACPYPLLVTQDGSLNAFADGDAIYVTTAMMRFAEDDELSVIVGHELAHNAMGHIDAKRSNALLGGFLGLLADVALATQGVNTGGAYTSQFAEFGGMTFSQDFEREADYVGMYALALAGHSLDETPTFWRHMAIANPGSIQMAASHPTTAERFVRLEQTIAEIAAKRRSGQPLRPEMKEEDDR